MTSIKPLSNVLFYANFLKWNINQCVDVCNGHTSLFQSKTTQFSVQWNYELVIDIIVAAELHYLILDEDKISKILLMIIKVVQETINIRNNYQVALLIAMQWCLYLNVL